MPVGVQQKIELLKVLYRGASILILDEPTAVLTPQEVDELFQMLRNLQKQGKTIILITHKLDEVMAIADRVTVMRRGKTVKTVPKDSTTSGELASLMVGRNVILDIKPPPVKPGERVLTVRNLSLQEPGSARVLVDGVSFEVREGEILGIAGVSGNGQSELAELLTGLTRPTSGEILIRGQEVTFGSVRRKRESGIAHIPEDRRNTGLVMALSVEDNLTIGHQDKPELSGKVLLKREAIGERSDRLIKMFDIRPPRRDVAAWHLSGGNQQKVIVARELDHDPQVLVANQPTRGLDVAAMEYVYHHLLEARNQGKAIVLISMELDEILTLSDRILVMYNGRIVGEFARKNADIEQIGLLMLQEGSWVEMKITSGLGSALIAVCIGIGISLILALLTGASPILTLQALWVGSFGSPDSLAVTINNAVPLILTGMAVLVAFRTGLFNIGGEGQMYWEPWGRFWSAFMWIFLRSLRFPY